MIYENGTVKDEAEDFDSTILKTGFQNLAVFLETAGNR